MSNFKLHFKTVDLQLAQPFTISRGIKETVSNVFVELTDGSHSGYGEAAPNTRYNEDATLVSRFLEQLSGSFFNEIESPAELAQKLDTVSPAVQSAKAAVEMAWLDWWGKSRDEPLWRLWEAPSSTGPVTSYTIGLDTVDVMQAKVEAAAEYPVYKVKLGTDRDREIIEALREVTDKPIRVDANEGWKTLEQAKEMIQFLAEKNIELIEQPMPSEQFADLKKLKKFSPLPLCADESFTGSEPLGEIAEAFDIINIKLMKMGSLVKAKRVIERASANNLDVMIGCMIESSVANTAGALLSLWTKYADLDGHLLIRDDMASGLTLTKEKRIEMASGPGLGIEMK